LLVVEECVIALLLVVALFIDFEVLRMNVVSPTVKALRISFGLVPGGT
jgi:hypothetical protein